VDNATILALTDSQLAQLAIAATAVPSSQRGRWLKQIANELTRSVANGPKRS